jgi:hypothetical protein
MADTGVDVVFQVTDFTYEGDDEPLPVPSLPLEFEPWGVPKMVVFDERHALDLGSRKIPLVPAFTAPRKELIGIVANTDASDERVMAGTTSFSIPEVMSLCIAGGGPCVLLTCAPDAEATCMTTAATVFARASKDFKYRAGEKAHRNAARFAWGLLSARADAAPTKLGITRFDSQSARLVRSTLRPATVRELGPSASASASAAPPRSAPAKKQAP